MLMACCVWASVVGASVDVTDLKVAATDADGSLQFQAGSHPFAYTVDLELDAGAGDGLRAVYVRLPPGLVGDPLAIPRCSRQDFGGGSPRCPGSSQIGIVQARVAGLGDVKIPLYNVAPPPGAVASFGFSSNGFFDLQQISLRAGGDYGLTATQAPVSNSGVEAITETIWGVPADSSHDSERICVAPNGDRIEGCPSGLSPAPFLSLPTSCADPPRTAVSVESTGEEGILHSAGALSVDAAGHPTALAGCESVPFDPAIAVRFGNDAADSPTGSSVELHLPQPAAAGGLAEAHLRNADFELPEGMAINPAAAAGLAGCSPAQIGLESAPGQRPGQFTPAAAACPAASKVGSLEIDSPLVDHPLRGSVYLATPDLNPFASLLVIYLAVDDEQSGVVLKLSVQIDTGAEGKHLTLHLEDGPQLPFEDLKLSFPDGPRALLRTPTACRSAAVISDLTPWSSTGGRLKRLASPFQVAVGAGQDRPCPASETGAPSIPRFAAGVTVPAAGRHSPLVFRVSRDDGTQPLGAIEATLPAGVSARIAGIPPCAEDQIDAATCPSASAVGSVDVAAGAGPMPAHLAGLVYLAGPYKGAPFSLHILVPVRAGPFDLGTVGVRVALYVDPRTAQIHAASDPLPNVVRGVPLDLRSLAVSLDRQDFLLNPTSCAAQSIGVAATSTFGQRAVLSDRFQLRNCVGLGFKPKLAVAMIGPTRRGGHPTVRAVLRTRPGDANLSWAAMALPSTELLDSRHIRAVCERAELGGPSCPTTSAVGRIRIWTPMLDDPLEGAAFLLASDDRLPAIAANLHGDFDIGVRARLDTAAGRLRVTFASLPDVPISRLELTMPGGRKGLLVNSGSVCARPTKVRATLHAHNGRRVWRSPSLRTHCKT
jgi:hypothetical protein